MGFLEGSEKFADMSMEEYWKNQLEDSKMLLVQLDAAISALSGTLAESGGTTSYTIDTGQDRQQVTRADLPNLIARRSALINQIADLESRVNGRGAVRRIVPGF